MSENPWTPGPWSVFNRADTIAVCIGNEAEGKRPCIVDWPGFDSTGLPRAENLANARLIAAAPELADLVREYAWGNPTLQTDKRVDALLAKIYGDSQ